MQISIVKKMVGAGLILLFTIPRLISCSDNSSSDESSKKDSSTVSASTSNAADSSASKKTVKRKGKASVSAYENSKDKIVKGKDGVYNKVETMPEFPGGQTALDNYVENHLDYPQQALDDNIAGTVRISFVVDEHGKVVNPKIIGDKKLGDGLDEEALRVVNQMPEWKPGKVKGKNVKTRVQLPIRFMVEA